METQRPRRARRAWWLGGGAALAVVVAVVTVVVRAPGETAEPVFTHFPVASCALITRATADTYAPGTICGRSVNDSIGDWLSRDISWSPKPGDGTPQIATLSIALSINTGAHPDADADTWLLRDCQEWDGVPDLHPRSIVGIGDRACFLYATKYGAVANLDVRTRNVVIEVSYAPTSSHSAPAFSAQEGERAVRAVVADVMRQLS